MNNLKKISREEAAKLGQDNRTVYFDNKEKIANLDVIEIPDNLSLVQQLVIAKYYYISQDYQDFIYIYSHEQYNYGDLLCLFNKGYYCYKGNKKIAFLLESPKQQAIDYFRDAVKNNKISPFLTSFYKKKIINTLVRDPNEMLSINTTPIEQIKEIIPKKRELSFYLLNTKDFDSSSIESEHKPLLSYLQKHHPISFSIPSPNNICLDSNIINNYGIKLLSSIYKSILLINEDKDNSVLEILFSN
jgi:uncharacterized protein YfkK (UPF0435 family)